AKCSDITALTSRIFWNVSLRNAGTRNHSGGNTLPVKRVAVYTRVSSVDQHPETQLCDLRPLATARGFEIAGEYSDTLSGSQAKRHGLAQLMADARRGRCDGVRVGAVDGVGRSGEP